MKTKEELQAMSHIELVEYALNKQGEIILSLEYKERCKKMAEILSAIGIVYEVYKNNLKY